MCDRCRVVDTNEAFVTECEDEAVEAAEAAEAAEPWEATEAIEVVEEATDTTEEEGGRDDAERARRSSASVGSQLLSLSLSPEPELEPEPVLSREPPLAGSSARQANGGENGRLFSEPPSASPPPLPCLFMCVS